MKKFMSSFAVVVALAVAMMASAAEPVETPVAPKPKLGVGSPAPALTVGKWIQGEPVTAFATGTIYVVEFWATWCKPCIQSIPRLTKLQAQYKDKGVVIIGQNCMERYPDKVAGFVEKMGTNMAYRVALDDVSADKHGKMNTAWMEAARQQGIPTAFVVDKDGKIAWIGHPSSLDGVLEKIVAGTFDLKKAAELAEKELPSTAAEQLDEADELLADDQLTAAWKKTEEAIKADATLAKAALPIQYEILLKQNDAKGAAELGQKMGEALKDDADQLVEAAARLCFLHRQGIKQADLNLAEKMAQRAIEITKGGNGAALNRLTVVYMEQGRYDQALKSADKALACPKTGDDDDAHWWAQLSKREIFRKKNDYVAAEASGKQLIEASKNDEDQFEAAFVSLVPDKADEMTKADLALAEKLLEYAGTVVTDAGVKTKLQEMQFGLLILKKDYPAIHGRVEQILKTPNIETDALVEFAGLLLAEEKPDKAMLALAEKVMVRANEITKGQETELLAGLADIYAMQGNWTNATETLTKAIATVTDDELKQYLQKTLDEYKAKPNPAAPDHDEDECDGHAPRPTKSDPK